MAGHIVRRRRRASDISACGMCVTVVCSADEDYSCIQKPQDKCPNIILNLLLRKLLRKIGIYGGRKRITFQYDAVSYSQNFDDGCRRHG
ncbi:hypothetical protein F511_09694 [Dorcoceras hygrometricum]|uniref:Uncharacterized protein n=1 Tax=Dorcoceras hygrometricum TaxID=472368 RepID=A0A2Z7CVP7_9LAMI|nr:hypothetical protein F511_09694 [Dorcoceras hygrometricum]